MGTKMKITTYRNRPPHNLPRKNSQEMDIKEVFPGELQILKQVTEESFAAMTSNGDVKLDFHIHKLSFLNFLLGKLPNGPRMFVSNPLFVMLSWG